MDIGQVNSLITARALAKRAQCNVCLLRVIAYHKETGFYDVSDVDDEGRYSLPESQVRYDMLATLLQSFLM